MKRILITGVSSYIGNSVEKYLKECNEKKGQELYRIDKISLRDGAWERSSFSSYDAVLHVAGLAHADIGKVSEETKELYYAINSDLTVKVAQKAQAEGVSQFIYLSSVIVYGDSAGVGKAKHITKETIPQPANFYGDSKWQAEQRLQEMEGKRTKQSQAVAEEAIDSKALDISEETMKREENATFKIAILRPPMIYGKNSKGNFPMLVKLAEMLPFFPAIANQRSMLYVENLSEFIRLLVESGSGGLFFPQNAEYTTTSQMVEAISRAKGKKMRLTKLLNPFVRLASIMPGKIGGMANKAFGSLTIDMGLSECEFGNYRLYSLQESVEKSISLTNIP